MGYNNGIYGQRFGWSEIGEIDRPTGPRENYDEAVDLEALHFADTLENGSLKGHK